MTPIFHRRHFINMALAAHRKAMNERRCGNIAKSFALFAERDIHRERSRGRHL